MIPDYRVAANQKRQSKVIDMEEIRAIVTT